MKKRVLWIALIAAVALASAVFAVHRHQRGHESAAVTDRPNTSVRSQPLQVTPLTNEELAHYRSLMPAKMADATFNKIVAHNVAKGWRPTENVVQRRLRGTSASAVHVSYQDDDYYNDGNITLWDWDDADDSTLCDTVYIYDPDDDSDITYNVVLTGDTLGSLDGVSDEVLSWNVYGGSAPEPVPAGSAWHSRLHGPTLLRVALIPPCDVYYDPMGPDPYGGSAYMAVLVRNFGTSIKTTFGGAVANATVSTGVSTVVTTGVKGLANLKNVATNFLISLATNLAQATKLPSSQQVDDEVRAEHGCATGSIITLYPM